MSCRAPRWLACCLLAAASGCGGGGDDDDDDTGLHCIPGLVDCVDAGPDGDADADSDVDADGDTDADADGDADLAIDEGCPDLYRQSILPTFEVEIDDAEWQGIEAEFADPFGRMAQGLDPKPYHPLVSFRYGDEVVTDASIRLKGNPCCSWVPPKKQFVIAFNQQNRDGRFHGLRHINLDAPWYDTSLLHERLAEGLMREVGVPAACANSARLVVNGDYYGVYANLEHLDREFLERNFGADDAGGTLWKYGWEPKTNEDTADWTMINAFWAATDVPAIDALVDLDAALLEWASEAMLPDGDGYFCCTHNFYLYEHPTRGFVFVPSDKDFTFAGDAVLWSIPAELNMDGGWGWGGWTGSPRPQHVAPVLDDPAWWALYVDAVEQVRAGYDVATLTSRVDRWSSRIEESVEDDPNRTFTVEDHDHAIMALRDYIAPRAAFVDAWLSCVREEPGAADGDGDGWSWCSECNDFDPAVAPGAAEACNGVDDDCDGYVDDGAPCPDCSEVPIGDDRWMFCTSPRTWDDAAAECAIQGGVLGVPDDDESQWGLAGTVVGVAWADWSIGATNRASEGTFTAEDGGALPYVAWADGLPDGAETEGCVVLDAVLGGYWNNRPCEEAHPAVCLLQ